MNRRKNLKDRRKSLRKGRRAGDNPPTKEIPGVLDSGVCDCMDCSIAGEPTH